MGNKLRVGVLFGGRSGEHDVSLASSSSILSVISREKYEVIPIGITRQGDWVYGDDVMERMKAGDTDTLKRVTLLPDIKDKWLYGINSAAGQYALEPLVELDVIFPVLHGTFGEDGTLQGWLEIADMAYVGAGVLASSVAMDKALFKDVMIAHGIPIVESVLATRKQIEHDLEAVLDEAEALADYPLFVKPANLGSSVGVSRVNSRSDLVEGVMDAVRYDRRVVIERGVNAREIEISVLGNEDIEISVPGEIVPSDEFYSYKAKYVDDASGLLVPAPLPADLVEQMREMAGRVYRAVDCAGMTRVDFLLDKDSNEFFVNEVNTIPGFTQISMYPKLWEASGLPYKDLIDRLIELAVERKDDRDRIERSYG